MPHKPLLTVYSLSHALVDFSCAFLVYRTMLDAPELGLCLLLYNFCAFALQMPFGLLVDGWNRNGLTAAAGCALVACAYLPVLPALAASVTAGIGNGLFHVGGGLDVLNDSRERAAALGIFVSPGALGLYFGGILGREGQLLTWIQDTKLQKRCRIIASCTLSGNSSIPPSCLRFMDTLKCLTLKLPPLRQISSDIPALTSLFLGTLNPDLPQPIIGLEADAMKFMQNYSWPGNFPQFKRVLKQLASLSSSPYICLKDVKALLSQDESQEPHPARNGGFSIDLSGNLEEITKEIILQVLKETNSNQSAAAKRLGISRTTLWRYLNR